MSFSWPFSFVFSNLNVLLSFYVFLLSFFFKFIANFELLESDVLEETKMSMDFRIVFSQLGIKSLYHVSSQTLRNLDKIYTPSLNEIIASESISVNSSSIDLGLIRPEIISELPLMKVVIGAEYYQTCKGRALIKEILKYGFENRNTAGFVGHKTSYLKLRGVFRT